MPSPHYFGSRPKLAAQILIFAATLITMAPCGAAPKGFRLTSYWAALMLRLIGTSPACICSVHSMDGEAGASVLPISIENIKSMNFQNKLSIALTAAALLVTAPIRGASAADSLTENAQIVSDYLAYSREYYSGVHFVAIATLPSSFAYDRYPDNGEERIRCDEGTFAREYPGQPWLKSNDWGRTGSPADKGTAQKLENWIKLVNAAFVLTPASVKPAEKSEADGRVEWVFAAPSSDPKGAPTQFTFDKPTFDPNQNVLLHGFTASLRLQDDKVVPGGDGTATKNQLIYVLMKKDKLSGTVFFNAVGTRFETGNDGSCTYSW